MFSSNLMIHDKKLCKSVPDEYTLNEDTFNSKKWICVTAEELNQIDKSMLLTLGLLKMA